jgi:hypothetical protein
MAVNGLPGVDPLTVYRVGEPFVVFRIAKTDRPYEPHYLDAFRSNYELDRPPRREETRSTPVHMGISVYLSKARAMDTARTFPKIGDYVAEMRLQPDFGAAFALTAEPGHLTVWGRVLDLAAAVADIVAVER